MTASLCFSRSLTFCFSLSPLEMRPASGTNLSLGILPANSRVRYWINTCLSAASVGPSTRIAILVVTSGRRGGPCSRIHRACSLASTPADQECQPIGRPCHRPPSCRRRATRSGLRYRTNRSEWVATTSWERCAASRMRSARRFSISGCKLTSGSSINVMRGSPGFAITLRARGSGESPPTTRWRKTPSRIRGPAI